MPRSRNGVSVSRIFRDYLRENPELLSQASNIEIYERFQQDHPEIELTKAVQGVCANIKSIERKNMKVNGGVLPETPPRPRGRPSTKATGTPSATSTAPTATVATPTKAAPAMTASVASLNDLEEQIDAVLNVARGFDKSGLEDVIRHLRRARNLVSLKLDGMSGR